MRELRFAVLLAGVLGLALSPQQGKVTAGFDTRYESLDARQQNLVADWFGRYNRMYDKSLEPGGAYNELPLSTKTTFEAVTHALMRSGLTKDDGVALSAADGRPLRDALDLVDQLDAIKGRIKSGGGDEQFRIYVRLKTDAVRLLGESREFSRGADNSVYHRGYPMSFRSTRGVPSIQFSISETGEFADIDVDYRSSKFPLSLFNGHLTVANSDVRADDNYQRHLSGWSGLDEWWNGWDGLGEWWSALHGVRAPTTLPGTPRKAEGEVDLAVYDFLNSWLVEQNLDAAVAYFSKEAYKCLRKNDVGEKDGEVFPHEILLASMEAANHLLGKRSALETVVRGVALPDPRLTVLPDNEYEEMFVLSEVPRDHAIEFQCAFRGVSVPRAYRVASRQRGDFRLSSFFLRSGDMRGATISLLWTKEAGYWKIISYELEADVGLVPDLRPRALEPPTRTAESERVAADPEFVQRSVGFLNAWIVEKNYRKALEFISARSYPCVDRFETGTPTSREGSLSAGLESVADFVGELDRDQLADAIEAVEPRAPELKVLKESTEAYTLLSVPNQIASSLDCTIPQEMGGAPSYGTYYGTSFRLKLVDEDPAAFLLIWSKENGVFKVVAFDLVGT